LAGEDVQSRRSLGIIEPVRTEILPATEEHIARAAAVIRAGGLVAFPTETVYGLGADALNEDAVRKIFLAKERPADDPLIVHIASASQLPQLARQIPQRAWDLIERFWPGPLTLVLPKTERVPTVTTGGLDTVAVRMPSHPVAKRLIELSAVPIAAPSANRFGRPSPTIAKHVWEDLHGRIELILDGGPTPIGVESTVLDLTVDPPMVLRPGGVTLEELRAVLGDVQMLDAAHTEAAKRSPGTRSRHYAPRAQVLLVEQGAAEAALKELSGKRVGVLVHGTRLRLDRTSSPANGRRRRTVQTKSGPSPCRGGAGGEVIIIQMPRSLKAYARRLFAALRELDEQGVDVIVVEKLQERGLGRAIMDRLRRASQAPQASLDVHRAAEGGTANGPGEAWPPAAARCIIQTKSGGDSLEQANSSEGDRTSAPSV
jgi:L-threonylcarbamoyladenylate synthase